MRIPQEAAAKRMFHMSIKFSLEGTFRVSMNTVHNDFEEMAITACRG